MLYTLGFDFYKGYRFFMSVTEGLKELECEEAKEYYKIIFFKSGTNHFVLNNKECVLTGACTICLNERDTIAFQKAAENEAKILWFKPSLVNTKFTYEVMNAANGNLSQTEYQDLFYLKQFTLEAKEALKIVSLHTVDASGLEHKLKHIKKLLAEQEDGYWPCRSRSYLFDILFCLIRQEEGEACKIIFDYKEASRLAVDIIYYLQSCYDQKITVEKLAGHFHTNRTTLMIEFKKYTGKSVNEFITQLRLTMASTLLRDTELSVNEICDRTGFNDVSYFSKVFKKELNCTPSEYRRINQLTNKE